MHLASRLDTLCHDYRVSRDGVCLIEVCDTAAERLLVGLLGLQHPLRKCLQDSQSCVSGVAITGLQSLLLPAHMRGRADNPECSATPAKAFIEARAAQVFQHHQLVGRHRLRLLR